MKEIFTEIFEENKWNCSESVSGAGSTMGWPQTLRAGLPILLRGIGVRAFLDVPCGDFNWGKEVDWGDVNYIGGDIVESLVEKNKEHETQNIKFLHLDLSKDSLPSADVVLVRDCLMHMSVKDAESCLENVRGSKIKYLLASTYPTKEENSLTHRTSAYVCRYNLNVEPFNLGKPLLYLNDSNHALERQGIHKTLGLWKLEYEGDCENDYGDTEHPLNKHDEEQRYYNKWSADNDQTSEYGGV